MHLSDEMISRLIDGSLNSEKRNQCLNHLSECSECFEIYSESLKTLDAVAVEKPQRHMYLVKTRKKLLIPLLAAASILAFVFIWNAVKTPPPAQLAAEQQEIFVERGKQKEVLLADGTRVFLDSGSRFFYPREFGRQSREVTLEGVGYFEVTPDKKRPFFVKSHHAVIKVLGTKFNVRAWDKAGGIEVAVAEGQVSLRNRGADPESAVIISKNFYSILPAEGTASKPERVDINRHLGWMNRSASFLNTPLQEVLAQLERWYDIQFIPGENISLTDQLTIHIQDRPIEDILDLISDLTDIKYRREGSKVYLN